MYEHEVLLLIGSSFYYFRNMVDVDVMALPVKQVLAA
jgi:hypothetical protein